MDERDGQTSPQEDLLGQPASKRNADRRCGQCGVRLSLYNPGPNCWQHTIGHPWRGPSAKPRF